jgi:hypothetical protein
MQNKPLRFLKQYVFSYHSFFSIRIKNSRKKKGGLDRVLDHRRVRIPCAMFYNRNRLKKSTRQFIYLFLHHMQVVLQVQNAIADIIYFSGISGVNTAIK